MLPKLILRKIWVVDFFYQFPHCDSDFTFGEEGVITSLGISFGAIAMLVVCLLFGTTANIRTKPRKEIKQDRERSVYFFFRESKSAEKNGFTTS